MRTKEFKKLDIEEKLFTIYKEVHVIRGYQSNVVMPMLRELQTQTDEKKEQILPSIDNDIFQLVSEASEVVGLLSKLKGKFFRYSESDKARLRCYLDL